MNCLVNTSHGLEVYQNDGNMTIQKCHNLTYIKNLCHNHLFSYQGYIEAIKKVLGMSYKIPVYMSPYHQWIATSNIRSYDNIWINLANMKSFHKDLKGTRIVFLNGQTIAIQNKYEDIKRMIDKLNVIKAYKVKHFQ